MAFPHLSLHSQLFHLRKQSGSPLLGTVAPLSASLPCAPFLTAADVSPVWNIIVSKQIEPSQGSLVIASPSVVLKPCSQVVIRRWHAHSSLAGLEALQKCATTF